MELTLISGSIVLVGFLGITTVILKSNKPIAKTINHNAVVEQA